MISDERDAAFAPDPAFAAGMSNSQPHQAGAIFREFGECSKAEVRFQPGMLHLLPGDARQIPGDQPDHDAAPVETVEESSNAGTHLLPQIGAGTRVDELGVADDLR